MATERCSLQSGLDNLGLGLTAAVRDACAGLGGSAGLVDDIYCDLNGESYRAQEWGLAILRTHPWLRDPAGHIAPADRWGDLGAATGTALSMLPIEAWQRGYDRGSGSPPNSATLAGLLQEAKAKNPGNDDICGAGKHKESVQYPDVPKKEWHPNKRVEAMRRAAKTPEDQFEIAAAEHNISDGSITHGSQLSRNLTPEEQAAGEDPESQKIWAVCKVCGYRREMDQAPDKNNTVEAKSTSDAVKAAKQKKNRG